MAARTFTSAGVNNLWSNPANWDGGVAVPADNDSVTIPISQTCEFNVDQTLFADGIDGITVTGTLSLTRTAGTYYLKIKAAKTIGGAGTFDCGASALDPIPFTAKHTITGGAGWYIAGAAGLTMTAYAAEPAITAAYLSGAEGAGATRLEIGTDVTGDIWGVGDSVAVANMVAGSSWSVEIRVISAIDPGYIDISAGLTNGKAAGAVVILLTRNVRFIAAANGYICVGFGSGKLQIAGGLWQGNSGGRIISTGYAAISGGVCTGAGEAFHTLTALVISGGVYTTNRNTAYNSIGTLISGGFFCGNDNVLSGSSAASVITGGTYKGNTNVVSGCSGVSLFGGTCYVGQYFLTNCSATLKNVNVSGMQNDLRNSVVLSFNTLFGSATENSGYLDFRKEIYSESVDHDQVAGAYRAWTKGGVTTSVANPLPVGFTRAYQIALVNASNEGYWQREATVAAGASVNIEMWLRKDAAMTYLPRCLVFNKASTDPFAGGTALKTFTMTDSVDTYESDTYTYTNTGTEDVPLVIRFQGMNATGNVFTALTVEQINVDLTTALANIATIDGIVDAIKVKTDQLIFTVANQVDANALTGGGATAADVRIEMDANSTKLAAIVEDTGTTLPAAIAGVDTVVDAVKAKTDNLPSDPADESLLEAAIAAVDLSGVPADVWGYASRTLTQSAASVAAAVSGSAITITRGDTVTVSLTGLGSLAGRSKLYACFKTNKGYADSQSTMLIEETAGITVLNGAAYATTTDVTLTVNDENVGNITFVFKPAVSSVLPIENGYYDVQMVTAAGAVTTKSSSNYQVSADVTRAVS
ncbi:MAG: hypothetical protein ACYC6L_04735 [Anaerolineae bacterium]